MSALGARHPFRFPSRRPLPWVCCTRTCRPSGRTSRARHLRCHPYVQQTHFVVDVDVVRDVVDTHLPPLAEALRSHVPDD